MSQSFCHNMENEEKFMSRNIYRKLCFKQKKLLLMFKKARKAENKTFWVIEDGQHLKYKLKFRNNLRRWYYQNKKPLKYNKLFTLLSSPVSTVQMDCFNWMTKQSAGSKKSALTINEKLKLPSERTHKLVVGLFFSLNGFVISRIELARWMHKIHNGLVPTAVK